MNLEKSLLAYKQKAQPEPTEEKIQETIRKSKEIFFTSEQKRTLSYREFLWSQFKLIQKKWWFFQLLILLLLGITIISAYEEAYLSRGMGVLASIFAILIIPELWKNRSCHSMEIEESCYYSLRQIYSARMVLFGAVDVFLLTIFCGTMTFGEHIPFTKLLVQFLLPMLVTACICLGTLCSKYITDESVAMILCILWCALWLAITLNENVYKAVTMPIWVACIILSLGFLCIAIYHILKNCDNYWEVGFNDIRIE